MKTRAAQWKMEAAAIEKAQRTAAIEKAKDSKWINRKGENLKPTQKESDGENNIYIYIMFLMRVAVSY